MASNPSAEPGAGGDDGRVRRRYGSVLSRRPLPIRFDLGDSPPGLLGRVVHWWRYGSYHPDEDLLGVLDAAVDSLTAQIKAAEGFLTGSRRERLDAIRVELNAELADDVPEIAVLLGIEAKINALYPPAIQRQRAWMIQDRFKRVAPGQAADYWSAAREDSLLAEAHDDSVRRADEAVAAAAAAQTSAQQALAAADAALAAAKADHGDASAEAASAQSARDAAAASTADADWTATAAGLGRDLIHARCELERLQARLRGTERAARERRTDAAAATALIESMQREIGDAQGRVDAAAEAVQAHSATRPGVAPADPGANEGGGAVAGPGGASIDAEAQALLGYIHGAYLMGMARERAVRDLMRWVMMRFWSANIVLLLVLFLAWFVLATFTTGGRYALLIFGLFAIAAIGRVGATMSVVQRLQGAIANNVLSHDPIQELTRLRTGKNGINLALFSGGVFALLTYAFFASGVPALLGFDEGIAPAIATIQEDQQTQVEQQLAAQNLARAAHELQDQEERIRELEAELAQARRAGVAATGQSETPPEAGQTAGEGPPAAQPDATRIAAIEAQLAEARAALEQRRAALAVAAAAAAPPADAAVANAGGEAADGGSADGNNAADGNASRADTGDNAVAANAQAAAGPAGNVQAGDTGDKPAQQESEEPVAAVVGTDAGDQCNAKEPCDPFVRLALALGLNEREDFFKLLIWAFIAGFAERLVPDALDAIANRARRRRRRDGDEETA